MLSLFDQRLSAVMRARHSSCLWRSGDGVAAFSCSCTHVRRFLILLHCPDFVDYCFVGVVGLVLFLIRKCDKLGHDFEEAAIKVLGNVEQAGLVVLEFVVDKLFNGLVFHFFKNLCHHRGIKMFGDVAEIFEREVIGVSGGLLNPHFDAYSSRNSGADVFDHERNDHKIGDVFDDHAYGIVEVIKSFGVMADNFLCPQNNFLLLVVR